MKKTLKALDLYQNIKNAKMFYIFKTPINNLLTLSKNVLIFMIQHFQKQINQEYVKQRNLKIFSKAKETL